MPTETLADALNRDCHCINVDPRLLQQSLDTGLGEPGAYARLRETRPHLLADFPVFISREQIAIMQDVVDAIEHVVALRSYRDHVQGWAPDIATGSRGSRGVFFGYDFHLTNDGPQLIEVNTNAGGALLLYHLAAAQKACCTAVGDFFIGSGRGSDVERTFVDMFRDEFSTERPRDNLRCVAIVDENPEEQYLSPEFHLFQRMFASYGVEAIIADPGDFVLSDGRLRVRGRAIDLIYSRLTDFYLQSARCATLRKAYEVGAVVFTPSPKAHALYADKRNLTLFCDSDTLRRLGVSTKAVEILSEAVPPTVIVDDDNADLLWARRRQLYFKPIWGYGSRGTYKGAKLTKKAWSSILKSDYVAQELIAPSERLLVSNGESRTLKVDVRCYVYRGEVQMLGARMYRGQTTNFRTDGGGLAAVFTTSSPAFC